MRRAAFWKHSSAEALSRSLVDIVLFGRREAHQKEPAARRLMLRGEHPINVSTATATATRAVVSGEADYVLGYYDPIPPPKSILINALHPVSSELCIHLPLLPALFADL
jgi:hypothetical protein